MRIARLSRFSFALTFLVACAARTDGEEPDDERVGHTSAELVAVQGFGPNPAQLEMQKYVPEGMPTEPRPLVVVLHGCTQTPAAYESVGWGTLADEWKFYVVYPKQNTARNNSSGCFNWGGRWKSAPQAPFLSPEPLDLTEIQRGHGENESIKEMVDKMKADYAIDEKRVFVTGLSGGGAMAAVMLAVWPDVFSGGAIFAGIPYGCATDKKTTAEANNCLKDYSGENAYLARSAKGWGDLVRAAAPAFKGPYPRVSIWQGTADYIVNPRNATELMKQWTDANGIDQTPDAEDKVEGFPHAEYKDASGKTLVETYAITGQGHGTEVAPSKPMDPAQASGPKCGKAGAYILNANICSTYYAAKFLGLDPAAPAEPNGGDGAPVGSGAAGGGSSTTPGPDRKPPSSGAGGMATPEERSAAATCSASHAPSTSAGAALVAGVAWAAWSRRRRREDPS